MKADLRHSPYHRRAFILPQGNMLQDRRLYFPRIALEFEKRSFSYFRPKIFTELNGDLGIVMSSNSFKFKINE